MSLFHTIERAMLPPPSTAMATRLPRQQASLGQAIVAPTFSFHQAAQTANHSLRVTIGGTPDQLNRFLSLKGRLCPLALLVGAPLIYTVKTIERLAFLHFSIAMFALSLLATVATASKYQPSKLYLDASVRTISNCIGTLAQECWDFISCERESLMLLIHPGRFANATATASGVDSDYLSCSGGQ